MTATRLLSPNRILCKDEVKQSSRTVELMAPISEEQIRDLKVGDVVKISGRIYTGRDAIHKHLTENDSPVDLDGQIIYHCGPVVAKDEAGNYKLKLRVRQHLPVKNRTKAKS